MNQHAPIQMQHFPLPEGGSRFDHHEQMTTPGQFYVHGDWFHFVDPKGWLLAIPFDGEKNRLGATWTFDGDYDAPTIHPSVNSKGHWHGWIRDGQMTTC